ncbi:DNA repair protein RadA [Escherichia coli]|uniref:DNA repair protein RadA n=1 Tax=Escherichia coli TaxID=562 RepID=A0A447Y2Z5_ECOLX|nr:DNA repair protein RadA [Escherichia coli]
MLRRQRWRVTSVSVAMPVAAGVAKVQKLSDISLEELPRFSTGFKEFDRVLGGGVVREVPF